MDYFLGEIRIFPYAAIPKGASWVPCNGQSLPVAQNQALYSLIRNSFGGDAQNFKLPNLNGRAVMGSGQNSGFTYNIGDAGGKEGVSLAISELPAHNHQLYAVKNYDSSVPSGKLFGNANVPNVPASKQNIGVVNMYAPANSTPVTILNSATIAAAGAGSAHENRMPFLPLVYCICIGGAIYPPRP
jgi:microcystin-dependent protein